MAKPELLNFIQTQQQRGLRREEIIYALQSHGWPIEEISEGFYELENPVPPPQYNQQMQAQSVYAPTRESEFMHAAKNPTLAIGAVMYLAGCLLNIGYLALVSGTFAVPSFIGLSAAITFVSGLIGAIVLYLITKLLKIPGSTFSKALFYGGLSFAVTFVLVLLAYAGMPPFLVPILGLVFNLAIFWYYYSVTVLKTLAVFGLWLVFGIAIFAVFAVIGAMAGVGILKLFFPSTQVMNEQPNFQNQQYQMNMQVN